MSVYEVVNGFSWITLTKLKHLYTVLNMIVHHAWGKGPPISVTGFSSQIHFLNWNGGAVSLDVYR